jgi:hypothetical protein
LDSYSASSLKQQSTRRYDEVLFVLDNTLSWILGPQLNFEQRGHHHIFLWTVVSVSQHYKNPTQRVCLVQSDHHHIYLWTVASVS